MGQSKGPIGQYRARSRGIDGIYCICGIVLSVTYGIHKGEERTNPTLSAIRI
jgi:hypothetical protein